MNADDSYTPFSSQQQLTPRQQSCALSATAMLRYTIYRRVSETFNAECIGFIGLHYCDLFVMLVFYVHNVIL